MGILFCITQEDLYSAMGAGLDVFSGADRKEQRRLEKIRRECDRTSRVFVRTMSGMNPPYTRKEAVNQIREEIVAGTILGWVFWQMASALIQRIVFYLWDRYHSDENPQAGNSTLYFGD